MRCDERCDGFGSGVAGLVRALPGRSARQGPALHLWPFWNLGLIGALMLLGTAGAAERLVLRDGFTIVGQAEVDGHRIAVRSGPRTFHFGARQLLQPEAADDGDTPVRFRLSQPVPKRRAAVTALSHYERATPFDDFGRRTVFFNDPKLGEVAVHQGITELSPGYTLVEGLNYSWQSALATSQIPPEQLLAVLRRAADPQEGLDQLNIVNFLIQAGHFKEAKAELKSGTERFAALSPQWTELAEKLDRRITEQALVVAHRAAGAGQFARARKVLAALEKLPVPAEAAPRVKVMATELLQLSQSVGEARALVERWAQAGAGQEPAGAEALEAIAAGLSPATLGRLQPALALAPQPNTKPTELAALAVSGWCIGPALAVKDWPPAQRLWEQRRALEHSLQARDPVAFEVRLAALRRLEPKADVLLEMIPRLGAPPTDIEPGKPATVVFQHEKLGECSYQVQLPPEYDPRREYATVVALKGAEWPLERVFDVWGAAAADHGAIVVAPEYRLDPSQPYQFSEAEHGAMSAVLADARRRFAVDADRVCLSGHGLGGVAAWDFGMAHPDEFAALVPFTSVPMFYSVRYWPNLKHLPVYAVEGALDGENPSVLQTHFARYFLHGLDALYVEYHGRGRETFASELPTIFEWLGRKRRSAFPAEIEAVSARHCDRRFYWVEIDSFLPNATVPPPLYNKSKFRPAKIDAKVADNNAVAITTSGIERLTVLISPQLLHLNAPELVIRSNRLVLHKGPIAPDVDTLVRELYQTGDRKRLVVKRIAAARL